MPSSRRRLLLGFSTLIALLVLLLTVATSQFYRIHQNIQQIIKVEHYKMALTWEMRHAGRERNMILHRLVIADDVFERDSLLQAGAHEIRRFIIAREALRESGLSPAEQMHFDETLRYAREAWVVQVGIEEAIQNEQFDRAQQLLSMELGPMQQRTLQQLDRFLELIQDNVKTAEAQASKAAYTAIILILIAGLVFILLGSALAGYVIRRTARTELAMQQETHRVETTLDAIADGAIYINKEGVINFINPAAQRILGVTEQAALGTPLSRWLFVASEEKRQLLYPLPEVFEPSGKLPVLWHEDAILLNHQDQLFHIELSITPINDASENPSAMVIAIRDTTEARELNKKLSWAATRDALTGLHNRYEFENYLNRLLEDTANSHRQHAILYIDLDQFKVVNDTCGHMAGDELLRQLSQLMGAFIREHDLLARLGGDEFGLLLVDCPLDQAKQIAKRLQMAANDYRFHWENRAFGIGMSIGLSVIDETTGNAQELLSHVDAACYVAKESGRNRIHVCEHDDMQVRNRTNEMQWTQRISHALEHDHMVLYSQSIEPLYPDGTRHMEILLRMLDGQGDFIQPGSFIPAAERFGMMQDIDKWVVQNTFQQLANCQFNEQCRVYAINLSGQTLNDKGMLHHIINLLDELAIPPERICFEITETSAISNLAHAKNFINILRGIGCRFSLDDFGSGMASFGYLRQLKVDYLKIDGSFVKNLCNEPTDRAIVESINNIGHVMGIKTIAEWVQDRQTAELLKDIGVDYVQGYGIHRPVPFASTLCARCA